jgi:hypothetical protein
MKTAKSLHIALNKIDPGFYKRDGALNACLNSATALADIATKEGYSKSIILHDSEATVMAFKTHMKQFAEELNPGDILLLTFSGHGGQLTDRNNDEPDGSDEAWCFYDNVIVDDDIYSLWSSFKEGVKIIVISDSCHSGSIIKSLLGKSTLRKERLNGCGSFPSILLFSACQDHQEAFDGVQYSRFVKLLLNVWNNGKFTGNYIDLHKAVGKESEYCQQPNIFLLGPKSTEILYQKPFKI